MLGHELLPEGLIDVSLDVLKHTTPDEREIIRIIVEIISELRDPLNEEDSQGTHLVTQIHSSCKLKAHLHIFGSKLQTPASKRAATCRLDTTRANHRES